tara:strand:+ start:2874 stop:3848 length:975 start_codon:yes stop_codon:yes gene_type:complete
MIIKNFELNEAKTSKFNIFLFYGKNEGFQNEIINNFFLNKFNGEVYKYDEPQFIENIDTIISGLLNKSLFEDQKIFIISRVSNKISEYIEIIEEKKLTEFKMIFKSSILEKKSKLRNLFEKSKNLAVIPFYEDNSNSLFTILVKLLKEKNIKLSRESINLLVDRASGDRENLLKELDKIYSYSLTNKNVDFKTVEKLSNLAENYGIDQLVESYLSRNKRKLSKILNENNFSDEDCMLMLRVILNKSKRLLGIIKKNSLNRSIEEVMASTKPPIFWKEKESIKKQVKIWKEEDLKNKIYQINEIELLIKSNSKNSLNIISDFILN